MKLEDAIKNEEFKKVLGEDGLAELQAVLGAPGKVKEESAKAARILAEKKTLQDKLAELEAELETAKNTGKPEAEKLKAELEKAGKRAADAEAKAKTLEGEFGKAKRTVALDKIAGGLKFIDALSATAVRTLLETAFASVENLEDPAAVEAALATFKESNRGIIAADVQASGGGTPRPGSNAQGGAKDPAKQTDAERAAYLTKKK